MSLKLQYTHMQIHQSIQKRTKSIRRTKTERRYCHNKGDAVVIFDAKDYLKESERQLNDIKL